MAPDRGRRIFFGILFAGAIGRAFEHSTSSDLWGLGLLLFLCAAMVAFLYVLEKYGVNLRPLSLKNALGIAVGVAIIGYLSLDGYSFRLGVVGNALVGQLSLFGFSFPYRSLLILLVLFVGGCGLLERRKR